MPRRLRLYIGAAAFLFIFALISINTSTTQHNRYYGDKRLMDFEEYFKPSEKPQTFYNYRFLNSPNVCDSGGPKLLIMVMSLPDMTSQRSSIRSTWGSVSRDGKYPGVRGHIDVKVVFLFGRQQDEDQNIQIVNESEKERDIIQASFKESYDNLTLKVLMGFRWVEQNCPKTKFIIKADEDTFLNVPHFMYQLDSKDWSNHILGPLAFSEFVIRDGKYRATKSSYVPNLYPPHVKGNLYAMSKNVSLKLLHTAQYMPYVRIEDAFITGILAKIHGIRHVDIPIAAYHRHIPASYCDIVNSKKVMSQQYTPEMMRRLWKMITNHEPCPQSFIDYFLR